MARRRGRLWTFVFCVLVGPLLTNTEVVAAQTPAALPPIKVTSVTGEVGLFNTITIKVDNLSAYLEQTGRDASKFILYLDWRPLKGVNSRLVKSTTDELKFDIRRTADSKSEWNALLGRPFASDKGFTYPVAVSIGYENENPIPSDGKKYSLIAVNKTGFWIFVSLFALTLFLFVWLAKNSNIIRDHGPKLPTKQKPYSLGRTQMAFWFFVVAASYVFIWMVTSDLESITESALALIGISAATALSAQVVGSSKSSNAESKRQDLEKEKAGLRTRLNELGQQIAASPAPANLSDLRKEEAEKNARLAQVDKEIQDLTDVVAPQQSEGFLNDVLTDVNGISLHRFQIAVWTIVLGCIFVASIYNSLAMPQFSGTLLALMGISGGTYVGFKFPEKQTEGG